jgi:hypothetical protein
VPTGSLFQSNAADNTGTGGYGEMSLDYDPDSTRRLNLALNIWGGNFPNNNTILSRLSDANGAEIAAFGSDICFRNPYGNGQLDLSYTKTIRHSTPTFTTDSRNLFVNRNARIAFEWRFGQVNAGGGKQSKKINNDDKSGR